MKPKNIIINIAILILALLILFIGYKLVFSGDNTTSSAGGGLVPAGFLSTDGTKSGSAEFLEALESVQGIKFSTDVFSRPAFKTLQDFSVTLIAKPKGRVNPFAPLGVGNITSTEEGDDEVGEDVTLETDTGETEALLDDTIETL